MVEDLLNLKEAAFGVTFQCYLLCMLTSFYDYTNSQHNAGLTKEGVDVQTLLFHFVLAGKWEL